MPFYSINNFKRHNDQKTIFNKLRFRNYSLKNTFNINIQQKQLCLTKTSPEFKSELFMGNSREQSKVVYNKQAFSQRIYNNLLWNINLM